MRIQKLLILLALAVGLYGQTTRVPPSGGGGLSGEFANAPACTASIKGQQYTITNATDSTACDGSGTAVNDCYCDGTSYVDVDNASGGGAGTGNTYITQTPAVDLTAEQALSALPTGIARIATTTGVITSLTDSAGIAANLSDETGSGALVFGTSPTLVTPALGTPSSATLTNATGLPVSTGISGFAAGIAAFLATPSSANLITAVTNETGTGALVFGTSPTLVTPALGTPSALVLTNATGLPLTTGVTGVLPVANFATGTPDGTKFVRDDGVLAVPPVAPTVVGFQIDPTGTVVTTGDERMCFPIPAALNGMGLTAVAIQTQAPDTTGLSAMVSRKRRSDASTWGTVDMLSTAITTDAGELNSATATTPAAIKSDGSELVATDDRVCYDQDAAADAEGLWFYATFATP